MADEGSPVPPLPLSPDGEVRLPTDVVQMEEISVISSKPVTPAIGMDGVTPRAMEAPHAPPLSSLRAISLKNIWLLPVI